MKTNNIDVVALAEDARALLAATAGVAGEGISEARQRVAALLGDGRTIAERVRNRAVDGARTTGLALHAHPYRAISIAFSVGALVAFLVSRRCSGGGGGSSA